MESIEFLKYVYFLTQVNKLGNMRIRTILKSISEPYDFFNCSPNDLRRIDGIDFIIAKEIFLARKNRNEYDSEFEKILTLAEKQQIGILSVFSEDYPFNLRNIFDAPVILYYKGKLDRADKFSISIVGTRSPTEYGKYTCEIFTEKLSKLKLPVISGFARGIDSIVHRICMKNNNLTYAVLGSGVDIIYPSENRKLYFDLIENGALISEFPIGAKPDKVNFPRRNRIISGISLGTLVIESGIKGGSLLTAEFAIDQNREVFATPGYINSKQSDGTNELIKKGQAKLVTDIEDILNELDHKLKPVLKREIAVKEESIVNELSMFEKKIYEVLDHQSKHIDMINEMTGLTISECLVNLLSLEFKGLVRQIPGKNFIRMN